jgi:hypothetical protein
MIEIEEENECPCEICLVRAVCSNRLIDQYKDGKYLIVERAEKCSQIIEYFGKFEDGRIKHSYEKIYKICKLFHATEDRFFLWRAR